MSCTPTTLWFFRDHSLCSGRNNGEGGMSQNPLHPCKLLKSLISSWIPPGPQTGMRNPHVTDVRHKARTILHRLQTSPSETPASRGTPRRERLGPHSVGHRAPPLFLSLWVLGETIHSHKTFYQRKILMSYLQELSP